jgi:hypothetical protein
MPCLCAKADFPATLCSATCSKKRKGRALRKRASFTPSGKPTANTAKRLPGLELKLPEFADTPSAASDHGSNFEYLDFRLANRTNAIVSNSPWHNITAHKL